MLLDMAGLKISQLTKLEQMTGTEAIPVEKGGENYSMTPDVLLKDVKGGMAGLVTRLNDYMYDVSLLMGKMAVRGTKGTTPTTQPNDQGYYNMDGAFVSGGAATIIARTYFTKTDKIYHFDIGYYNYSGLVDPAVLVLFDENDKVLMAIPWVEGGFLNKYLVFTSVVKKYGVTCGLTPVIKPYPPIINETYEIRDINTVISELNTEVSTIKSKVEALDLVTKDTFNNYMYDISGLLGKLAYRDGIGTDEKNIQGDGYFNSKGILVQSSGAGFVYQKLEIDSSKIYRIRQIVGSYSIVSALVLFDEHDEIISAVPYNYSSVSSDKYFVFAGVHSVGISFVKSDNDSRLESFDIQDLTNILNTQQGNRALYVAAGAVYNEQTGFYELNGLTDITEEQMRDIYNATNPVVSMNDRTAALSGLNIRTNLPFVVQGGYQTCRTHALFSGCRYLEVANLGIGKYYAQTISYAFRGCSNLVKITTVIDVSNLNLSHIFISCSKLETVNLEKVSKDISFSDSPLISLESLQYLITNAANTSAITVTVHADVYAKIQDESQTEWHALIEAATAKQITFATV